MELGVSPLVTTGMVMQLLAAAKMIDVNLNIREDRVLSKRVWIGIRYQSIHRITYQ